MSQSAPVALPHCSSIEHLLERVEPWPPSATAWLIALNPRSSTARLGRREALGREAVVLLALVLERDEHLLARRRAPAPSARGPRGSSWMSMRGSPVDVDTVGSGESLGSAAPAATQTRAATTRGKGADGTDGVHAAEGSSTGRALRSPTADVVIEDGKIVEVGPGLDGDEGVDVLGQGAAAGPVRLPHPPRDALRGLRRDRVDVRAVHLFVLHGSPRTFGGRSRSASRRCATRAAPTPG